MITTPNINIELSKELAKKVGAKIDQCYRNSCRAFEELEHQPGIESLYYCEGVIWHDWLALEHGWLEVNGQIVEVTLQSIWPQYYVPTIRLEAVERVKTMGYADGRFPLMEVFAFGHGSHMPDPTIKKMHSYSWNAAFRFGKVFWEEEIKRKRQAARW